MSKKLRVIVVDDEPLARADILALLDARSDIEVLATCANGTEALRAVEQHRPDVLLLDIRMPGTDGLRVVEELGAPKPYVIFVTAYDKYAIEAFRVRALDYLLKPVQSARLDEALARAREGAHTQPSAYLSEILVRVGMKDVVVRVSDVDWIEADTYCVQLHAGAKTHTLRERMHVLESQLDPRVFARVHRSAIVNLDRVSEIEHDGHGDHIIVMKTGARVQTSHARWMEFRDLLKARTTSSATASRTSRPSNSRTAMRRPST
ncbi:MAG TPA: LytTR family DNA-binding domain-containing protein [Gemmatimonadaceae bacterium]|nr:LytTR family DNA-binding domain-containing protein [Gemmatimonadaceae bacterium]